MHAVTYGVSRDQMMARHKSNHIQVVYANSPDEADRALWAKASMAAALGLEVSLCGTRRRRRSVVKRHARAKNCFRAKALLHRRHADPCVDSRGAAVENRMGCTTDQN